MADKLTDEVFKNRERIKRFEDNPTEENIVTIESEDISFDTELIKLQTTTTKKIVDDSGTTVSSETINTQKIGTFYARDLLLNILSGNGTDGVSGHVFGTGSNSSDRRTVNSLSNNVTGSLNVNESITNNTNNIVVNTEITNFDSISLSEDDITEIGVETVGGDLLQYITDE